MRMYGDLFPNGNQEKYTNILVKMMDTNHDGEIDFRETMMYMYSNVKGNARAKLEIAIKLHDENAPNAVGLPEVIYVMKQLSDLEEIEGHERPTTASVMERSKQLLDECDRSGDGKITKEDLF